MQLVAKKGNLIENTLWSNPETNYSRGLRARLFVEPFAAKSRCSN